MPVFSPLLTLGGSRAADNNWNGGRFTGNVRATNSVQNTDESEVSALDAASDLQKERYESSSSPEGTRAVCLA